MWGSSQIRRDLRRILYGRNGDRRVALGQSHQERSMASSTLCVPFRDSHRYAAASAVLLTCTLAASPVLAQLGGDHAATGAAQQGAIAHAQRMRVFPDAENAAQAAPPVIPGSETDID